MIRSISVFPKAFALAIICVDLSVSSGTLGKKFAGMGYEIGLNGHQFESPSEVRNCTEISAVRKLRYSSRLKGKTATETATSFVNAGKTPSDVN